LTTLQRWRQQFAGDGDCVDRRRGSHRHVAHRLSEDERQRILLTFNEPEFTALPPGQIVLALADRGLYIGSERRFYRVFHAHGQVCFLTRSFSSPEQGELLKGGAACQGHVAPAAVIDRQVAAQPAVALC